MTDTNRAPSPARRIAVLGTGNVARALGARWAARGHTIAVGGRSLEKTRSLAGELGHDTVASTLPEAVAGADVVLLAVPWAAVDVVLSDVDAGAGGLSAKTVIDPTNPVEHGQGRHLLDTGSAAEHIASRAPGAHVVKAFNVHPAAHWVHASPEDVVTIAGGDATALDVVRHLVRDVGATPHTLGDLGRARQIEELAATVIALAFGGVRPRSAVPEA
jgi:predicted dinucleotide-binding enzyme